MASFPDSGRTSTESNQRLVFLAVFVVLLGAGFAITGWFIISVLSSMEGEDPFTMERGYEVSGTYVLESVERPCTGEIVTHYSSETSSFCVFTYDLSYGDGDNRYSESFNLMFDSGRNPTDMFQPLGEKDGYSMWKGTDKGVDVVYYLDADMIVRMMDIDDGRGMLKASAKGR